MARATFSKDVITAAAHCLIVPLNGFWPEKQSSCAAA